VRVTRVDDPIERELDRRRVERRPVVEADAAAELERPHEAVVGRRPRLCEPGNDVGAVVGRADECLEDLGGDAQGVKAERLAGIEARRLGLHADHEHLARGLRRRGSGEQDRGERGHDEGARS